MTFVTLLAAYIFIGLLAACALALWAACPRSGYFELEDILGGAILWPAVLIMLILTGTKRAWAAASDWVYRVSDSVAAAMPSNYRIYPA